MTEWTSQAVASRFAEAARTARRLPPVRVQGHFNVWPPFVRTEAEVLCAEDPPPRRFPPSPAEIERMSPRLNIALMALPSSITLYPISQNGHRHHGQHHNSQP